MTVRRLAIPLAALLAVACAPANPAGGGSPAPGGSASPKPGATASPAPGATPGATASAGATVAVGPAVPNTGTFTFAAGQQLKYLVNEKGATSGLEVRHVTIKIGSVEGNVAKYEVLQRVKPDQADLPIASAGLYTDVPHPSGQFVDNTLSRHPALVAANQPNFDAAKDQGEEVVTVPAGTFMCAKTLYDRDLGSGRRLNITLWENGTAGLVKAQVSNAASLGAATLTQDIRWELEAKP